MASWYQNIKDGDATKAEPNVVSQVAMEVAKIIAKNHDSKVMNGQCEFIPPTNDEWPKNHKYEVQIIIGKDKDYRVSSTKYGFRLYALATQGPGIWSQVTVGWDEDYHFIEGFNKSIESHWNPNIIGILLNHDKEQYRRRLKPRRWLYTALDTKNSQWEGRLIEEASNGIAKEMASNEKMKIDVIFAELIRINSDQSREYMLHVRFKNQDTEDSKSYIAAETDFIGRYEKNTIDDGLRYVVSWRGNYEFMTMTLLKSKTTQSSNILYTLDEVHKYA